MNSKIKTILLAAVLSFSAQGASLGGFEMVRFENGTFTMGSPEDEEGRDGNEGQVEVTLNRVFEIGKYEVTQQKWFAVMDSNPSRFSEKEYCPQDYTEMTNADGEKVGMCPKHPVERVSWNETQEFFRRLNLRDGNTGCEGNPRKKGCWRLPTEAEWEYAARAGTETRYSFGDHEDDLDGYGWYWKNSDKQTHRVGMKKANIEGLHDMHGNVWEWTMDYYGRKLPGGVDPLRAKPEIAKPEIAEGGYHVIRGGGWSYDAQSLRSASRDGYWVEWYFNVGLRAVRTL